jgi:CheY-like chemotaxis protein
MMCALVLRNADRATMRVARDGLRRAASRDLRLSDTRGAFDVSASFSRAVRMTTTNLIDLDTSGDDHAAPSEPSLGSLLEAGPGSVVRVHEAGQIPELTVLAVGDDEDSCYLLEWLLKPIGLRVESYTSTREFLDAFDPERPKCLVLDIRMPGLSGLDLQEELAARARLTETLIRLGISPVRASSRAIQTCS